MSRVAHHWCADADVALQYAIRPASEQENLKLTDNLSRTLQKQEMSAAERQAVAELTVRTLKAMRSEESFGLFFDLVDRFRELTGTQPPALPRKRRAPQRYEVGSGEGSHCTTVEDHYRLQYFEVLDIAIASITDRFNHQPGYAVYKRLEGLLVNAANGETYDQYFDSVTTFYKDDFDRGLLSAQLQNLTTWFAGNTVSLKECLAFLRALPQAQKSFFSEVCRLVNLTLVMPATNAVSERSFSAMRRLKTYLRRTMRQSRLNHVMILSINRQKVELDIDVIADEFVRANEHRLRQFGKFTGNA